VPDVLPDVPFVAVRSYVGTKTGFVYKLDALGLGYYRDDGKIHPPADNGYVRSVPVAIVLEELLLPPVAGTLPWICSSWLRYTLGTAAAGVGRAKLPRHRLVNGKRARQRGRKAHGCSEFIVPPTAAAADDPWKSAGFWALDAYNPNAWSSAADALATSAADYMLLQEVREPDQAKCRRLEHSAQFAGWQVSINQATRTPAGGRPLGWLFLLKEVLG